MQTLAANGFQVARHLRLEAAERQRLVGLHLPQRLQGVVAAEGGPAREHLVEDGAQGVNVRRRADGPGIARRLFRSHVAGRSEDRTGLRLAGMDGELERLAHELGQAEVGDLRREVRRQKTEDRSQKQRHSTILTSDSWLLSSAG